MILSSMRASPIVDLTLTQLATTPHCSALMDEANNTHCMNDVGSDKSVHIYTREASAYSSTNTIFYQQLLKVSKTPVMGPPR